MRRSFGLRVADYPTRAAYQQALRAARMAAGCCMYCTATATRGQRCDRHANKGRVARKQLERSRAKDSCCVRCGAPTTGLRMCREHMDRANERNRRRRARLIAINRCLSCDQAVVARARCIAHLQDTTVYVAKVSRARGVESCSACKMLGHRKTVCHLLLPETRLLIQAIAMKRVLSFVKSRPSED